MTMSALDNPHDRLPISALHLSPEDKDVLVRYLAIYQAWATAILSPEGIDLPYVRALQQQIVDFETRHPWVKEH